MAVINLQHQPAHQLPRGAVYIGGANPHLGLRRSIFANPYPINTRTTRAQSLEKYRRWLRTALVRGTLSIHDLAALEGKDLACYCAPQPCHGDILEQAIAWALWAQADPSAPPLPPEFD